MALKSRKAGKKEEKRSVIQTCLDLVRLIWNRLSLLGFARIKAKEKKKKREKEKNTVTIHQVRSVCKNYMRSPEFASDAIMALFSRVIT